MKLLLIYPNRCRTMMPAFPLGLACVLGNMDRTKHQVKVLDLMFKDNPEDVIKEEIPKFEPDLIGFSIRNFDELGFITDTFYLPDIKRLVDCCRSVSQAAFVFGGAGFTIMPRQMMEYFQGDFGLAGEGELAFPTLLERLEAGKDYRNIPGLIFKQGDTFEMNSFQRIEHLDTLKLPDRSSFNLVQYAENKGMANVYTKRGCPHKCLWCPAPNFPGKDIALRTPSRVVEEIDQIKRETGISAFYFVDDIFNYPLDHAKAVCQELISRKLNIRWSCDIHPKHIDKELVGLMKRSGCLFVSPHITSASNKMLRMFKTDLTVDDIKRCYALCDEVGLLAFGFILLGGPGEDRQTVEESISLVKDINIPLIFAGTRIRILPNSGMARVAIQEGVISRDDKLLQPTFYLSKEVGDWLEERLKEEAKGDPRWVTPDNFDKLDFSSGWDAF